MSIHWQALFGTDGVRGIAGTELTAEVASAIGRAWGALLREEGPRPRVLLCRDTRSSGRMLSEAAAEGLCEAGVDATDCGILPTGALCLLVSRSDAAGGLIVSASHNPPAANGIKLVGPRGHKLPVDLQRRVEDLLQAGAPAAEEAQKGCCSDDPQAVERYLDLLFDLLDGIDLGGLPVLLDCAHGAASMVAPRAFERAGASVTTICCDTAGEQINVQCGSTHPETVARTLVDRQAALGVAFDGDADRAVFADHLGNVVDGDGAKYLLAADLQSRDLLSPPVVVGTVMNNFGLERALRARGIELLRTPVGDRHVVAEMQRLGAKLGGEQSGHIVFGDTLIGDGVLTALRVAGVIARTGQSLHELAAPVAKIPQLLVNVPVADREAWRQAPEIAREIERWEQQLDGRGRVLVRASGTEPLVRVMVEADDDKLAREACDALAAIIAAHQ